MFASKPALPANVRVALQHYGLSRFAQEPRDAFLGLITAIESVAEPQLQSQARVELVNKLLDILPSADRDDPSFAGRLRSLKFESISQACQRLVREALGEEHAATFKRLYNTRSNLSHKGTAGTDFYAERTEAERLAIGLLLHLTREQGP